MLIEGIKKELEAETVKKLTPAVLFVQGVATSIDALSVGFAFAEYDFYNRSDGVAAYRSRYLRAMYRRPLYR